MILAARRAEYDYYQRGQLLGPDRFIPTPDAVIKVMLEAALRLVGVTEPVAAPDGAAEPVRAPGRIVRAYKPKPRR